MKGNEITAAQRLEMQIMRTMSSRSAHSLSRCIRVPASAAAMLFIATCLACGEEAQDPARPEPGNPPTVIFAKSNAESEVKLVTERFGRPYPNKLHWSIDPAVCRNFEPTGFGDQIIRCGDYTALSNKGLYWSHEENQDTSQDMQASVLVFKGEQRAFVARGYQFSGFNYDAARKVLNFQYWTGLMGDEQIIEITMHLGGEAIQIQTRSKSTKD